MVVVEDLHLELVLGVVGVVEEHAAVGGRVHHVGEVEHEVLVVLLREERLACPRDEIALLVPRPARLGAFGVREVLVEHVLPAV